MEKEKVYKLIISVVLIGAIVPFAVQFILPIFKPCVKIVGVEVWNQYVGIILGIIATITSIVSLVLGFKSKEESYDTERRTRDLLQDIKGIVTLVSQKQDMLQNNINREYAITNKINREHYDSRINVQDECIN